MSTDGPQPVEWLAIAFLVDASLTLSYEWKRLFQDYIVQLLHRCDSLSSGANKLTRVAFITYGTADTLPSPIVKKTYFTELRYIIQDIKDDSKRLGIGETDSGGGKGMAALEGFATVLDMFDILRNVGPKELDCRVIHIAASPPDSSEHPHYNQSPQLDSLTWELLPAEFKKRNIQLSGINLSSGLPRFPELYTQAASGNPTTPWFNVKTQHHIFINGFTSIKAKRTAEPTTVDRTPEAKRPRTTQPPTDATSPPNAPGQTTPSAPANTSTPPTAPLTSGTNATQPLTVQPVGPSNTPFTAPSAQVQAQPGITPQFRQQLMQQAQLILTKRKQLEEESKMLAARKQVAMAQGNAEISNFCDVEISKRQEAFLKLGQALAALQQQARRGQPGLQNTIPQGQEPPQSTPPNPAVPQITRSLTSPSAPTNKDPQTPFNQVTTPRQPSNAQSPMQTLQGTPARPINTASGPTPTPNPPMSSPSQHPIHPMAKAGGLSTQMQRPIQSTQTPMNVPSTSAPTPASSVEVGVRNHNGPVSVNIAPQPAPQPGQPSNLSQVQSVLVWEGVLSFNGTGSDGNRKEVRTAVSASSSNAANSHSETWPTSMILLPSMTPAVSIPEFQDWIRRTKPVLCTFKARTPEDETNYQMLVSVMSSKRMYATSSWSLPNGAHKENVLIFPINNMGLCGAFFPLNGIPEMPKSASAPVPQIPPAILNIISHLPLEQRPAAIQQIRQKVAAGPEVATSFFRALLQRQMQQQQQTQNRVAMANQFGLNPSMAQLGTMSGNPNLMGMMGMNSMNGGANNPLATMGNQSGMLQNMARGVTGGGSGAGMNLNYDVLQSFMQRNNPDGNNAPGMGPS